MLYGGKTLAMQLEDMQRLKKLELTGELSAGVLQTPGGCTIV